MQHPRFNPAHDDVPITRREKVDDFPCVADEEGRGLWAGSWVGGWGGRGARAEEGLSEKGDGGVGA